MSLEIYGAFLDPSIIEKWVEDTMKIWAPAYVQEVKRQRGWDDLPDIKGWSQMATLDKWPETQLPAFVLISPGLYDEPTRHGDGRYTARYSVATAVVCSGKDKLNTNKNAKAYSAVTRAVLLQHPSLGGHAAGITWLDERCDDLPSEGSRTLGAGQNVFSVEVEGVIDASKGPANPPEDPTADPGDLARVGETEIEEGSME